MLAVGTGGQCDHRQAGQARVFAQQAGGLVAVQGRHLHVHQQQLEAAGIAPQPLQRLLAVVGQFHQRAFAFEDALRDLAIDLAVVHHQQPRAGQARGAVAAEQGRRAVAAAARQQRGDGAVQRRGGNRLGHHRVHVTGRVVLLFQQAALVGGDHDDDRLPVRRRLRADALRHA